MAIPNAKCPNCQEVIPNIVIEPIPVQKQFAGGWNGVSFLCPRCRTILGIQFDPVALRQDLVESVLKLLGK